MKKRTTEQFIEEARKVHGNKYDYSKTIYINSYTKVKIICPIHGEFEQLAQNHLEGRGCHSCALETMAAKARTRNCSIRKTQEQFILDCKKTHGDKYDYSKVIYIKDSEKVEIVCPKHGSFWQKARNHLNGDGCPACALEALKRPQITLEEFIERSNLIHNNEYDYSKVVFNGTHKLVEIICPKHGTFRQMPFKHLQGQGCPVCKESIGEKAVRRFLISKDIEFEAQKTFPNLPKLKFDFYIPSKNIAIEFDGEQHRRYDNFYSLRESQKKHKTVEEIFEAQVARDKLKDQYCLDNNIQLIRINNVKDVAPMLSSL